MSSKDLEQIKKAVQDKLKTDAPEKKQKSWVRRSHQLPRWMDEDLQKMADEENRPFNNLVNTILKQAIVQWHLDSGTTPQGE